MAPLTNDDSTVYYINEHWSEAFGLFREQFGYTPGNVFLGEYIDCGQYDSMNILGILRSAKWGARQADESLDAAYIQVTYISVHSENDKIFPKPQSSHSSSIQDTGFQNIM